MPDIGGTDPADLVARARAELGFSRLLEQPRRVVPPPRFEEGKAIVIGGIVIAGGGCEEERSEATAIIVATGKEGEGTKRTRRTDH